MAIDPDAPWQLNLLAILLVSLITGGVSVLGAWLSTRNKLAAIAHEVRPNSGSSLADAINRTEAAQLVMTGQVAGLRDDVGGIHSEIRDVRQDIAGVRADGRHDRRDIAQVRQALDDHLQAVPGLLAETLAKAAEAQKTTDPEPPTRRR